MARLAVLGGTPLCTHPFPEWPQRGEREVELLSEVVHSGHYGFFSGDKQFRFQQAFAHFQGARFGIAVSNATVGLQVALLAAGVGPGDEVIVPAFTWVATASVALFVGAIPVFAEIDAETFCLDPQAAEAAITSRTGAIIPVHLYGCMADLDALMDLSEKYKIPIIEDCAHAHGSQWRGQGAGSMGHLGVFSFQETKTMSSGEGGILLTSDPTLEALCHSFINCGRLRPGDHLPERVLGYNFRVTEFQAAVLLAALERLENQTRKREDNARVLDRYLAEIEGILPMRRDPRVTRQGFYVYTFRWEPEAWGGATRDQFLVALQAEGIPINPLYTPVYRSELFPNASRFYPQVVGQVYAELRLPITEQVAEQVAVGLPHRVLLGSEQDVIAVVEAVAKLGANIDELRRVPVVSPSTLRD